MIMLTLIGCSSAPPIQKASMTKSYFDGAAYPGEVYKLAEDSSGAEQYRVFSHGSTGFVSLASVQSNADGRAKDFCGREGKTIKVLQQQTSTPPHVLGNFPRVELIFICVDTNAVINWPSKPATSGVASSNGVPLTSMEQAKSKCKDLGFKVGTESFGQCVLKISK
jgi:hypothetical protein